jgi:DNA polymerase-3 subunit epsilon
MAAWMPSLDATFAALDFELADAPPDSACAVGLARVEQGRVVCVERRLIRPPRPDFRHGWVHGITWEQVADAPVFVDVWAELRPLLAGCAFLCAHNAGIEKRVLRASLEPHGLAVPDLPWQCTVQLARRQWKVHKANLPAVCALLGIDLQHHDPGSDAEACARIVLAAAAGWQPPQSV